MCCVVRSLPDRAVVAVLDHTVAVVPLVVPAVFVRLAGETQIDQVTRAAGIAGGAPPEPASRLGHHGNVRQATGPATAFESVSRP